MTCVAGRSVVRTVTAALAFSALFWLLLARATPSQAGGVVTNCSNDVEFTQRLGGGGSVTFGCGAQTITLASTKTITQNTTIDGGNAIALSGGGVRRLFVVNAGATLTLNNITIRDGNSGASDGGAVFVNNGGTLAIAGSRFYSNTTGSNQGGGALTTYGALTINGSEFAYNRAGGGGALNTVFGGAVALVSNSAFHHNQALNAQGGAIYIRDAAPMTLTQVMLSQNKALGQGGSIFVSGTGSNLIVNDSHVLSNTALTAGGGGIYSQGALAVISSTIEHNHADSVGGGLSVEGGAFISKTLVYSNSSNYGGGGLNGAATASLSLIYSTVDQNYTYGGDGGGIRSLGNLVLTDTFVTKNTADAGPGDSYGGGIHHQAGNLRVIGNVSSNLAKYGAAINVGSGAATVRSSFIAFNRATGDGGAVRNAGGSTAVDNSTIFGNSAGNNGGGIANQGALTVTRTSISINHAPNYGGGIYQQSGTSVFISSTVDSNDTSGFGTGNGGGIYNAGGAMALINTLVNYNVANYRGGGILNFATLTLDRTLVRNNTSYGGDGSLSTFGGGGIYNFATATVANSIVRDNATTAQDGAGFYNGWYANATLANVTFANNSAAQDGGGFKNNLGIATLTNVTFSGNRANADGGGVFSDHGQTNLRHVTFSGNSAYNGGAIYNLTIYTTRTVSLQNTIIANSPSGFNCVSNYPGSLNVVSQQFNLSDDGSFDNAGACPAFGVNDLSYTNPNLGVLFNHGGPGVGPDLEPMPMHMPRVGSPAVDKIPSGFNGCGNTFQTDQRGFQRPYNVYCDVGAVEVRPGDTAPWLWLPVIRR